MNHEYTIIFLHGFGASAKDYNTFNKNENIKLIFPKASFRETWYDSPKCASWYFFKTDKDGWQQDLPEEKSLETSKTTLLDIIKKECELVGQNNVFLGGSSQGCGMAFHCYAALNFQLAGFIGIRGMILDTTEIPEIKSDNRAIFHYGELDGVIRPSQTRKSTRRLKDNLHYTLKKHKDVDHDFGEELEEKCIYNFLKTLAQK